VGGGVHGAELGDGDAGVDLGRLIDWVDQQGISSREGNRTPAPGDRATADYGPTRREKVRLATRFAQPLRAPPEIAKPGSTVSASTTT
jgi:hypothetical protein